MPQSLSKVILHIVFSTKNRTPFLNKTIIAEMHRYLAVSARDQEWESYRVGGVEDHVHLLVKQPRTAKLSDFIGHLKRNSTKWIKTKGEKYENFSWQDGYGAFSIGYSQITDVIQYVENQEKHHEKMTFQDEFRALLKKYDVDYDERYVWD